MVFVLGNLPDNVKKKDIKMLIGHHKRCKVKFLKNQISQHSNYECLVTVDVNDPVAGCILEDHLNNMCWKGVNITAHRLLFD